MKSIICGLGIGLMLLTGVLRADTLDAVAATWTGSVGGASVVLNAANGDFLDVRWGNPAGGGQSGLGFDAAAPPPQGLPTIGDPFLLGTLRHYNEPIQAGTAASSADLSLDVDMTIGGTPLSTGPFNFRFLVDETSNATPCAYPSTTPCADAITFQNLITSDTFTIGTDVYTISILGFSDTLGGALVSSFISQEGGTNDAFLYAAITPPTPATPEPSTMAILFVVGAAVAVPLRRRIKS